MQENKELEQMRASTQAMNDSIDRFNASFVQNDDVSEIEERIKRLEANGIKLNEEPAVAEDLINSVVEETPTTEDLLQDMQEKVAETVEAVKDPAEVRAEELANKLNDRIDSIKTAIVGEDNKFDKEDIERLSKEAVNKVNVATEKVKETVLGDDAKFTEEDVKRLAHGLQEVGASLAKLGEKGFSKLVKLLEEDK